MNKVFRLLLLAGIVATTLAAIATPLAAAPAPSASYILPQPGIVADTDTLETVRPPFPPPIPIPEPPIPPKV